ncbi:MAG TPA: cation transporter [Thermomonas sp.]|mgnify:CR=1 FL=1|jgi:copper chaperone|uniref:heavy-metal-associated domain-containing protein n=1 Tax=Thermomonas sp. TaxID=1971895 RepID=UPI002C121443|nr:cation transporter [Thermomonas sp.]HOV95781.1 cation transporter [Thermomonas sp.]
MLLKVENMRCQHCVNSVTRTLQALDASAQVHVDLTQGTVHALGNFTADAAIAALAEEDYPAQLLAANA